MRIPLGFLLERLTEMLEDKYGAEAMISIESDIRSKGRNSLFYKETKTYYDYFRRQGTMHSSRAGLRDCNQPLPL